jgi:hypothetical protein
LDDLHVPGLFFAEGQVIAAEAEFNRVAQRRPANDLDLGAVAKAHLQQPTANLRIATNGKHMPFAPDAELV